MTETESVPGPTDAPTRPDAPFRLGHRPELDGLRGVAVVLVVAYHLDRMWADLGQNLLPGGYLGVDLFLVLSGFLITALLLGEHDAAGAIDLRDFLRRRARRLVPALVAVLAAVLVVAIGDRSVLDRSVYDTADVLAGSAWVLTFTANWAIVFDHDFGPLGHLWTIGVEGQFYVVWALALVALLARRPRAIAWAAVTAIVAIGAWRWYQYEVNPDDVFALYVSTLTRLDAPLVGAVAGVVVARGWAGALRGRAADVCLVGGLAAVVATAAIVHMFEPAMFRGGFTLVALAGAAAVVGAVQADGGRATRWLRARPLVAAGRGSYSLYLWHLPVFMMVGREARDLHPAVRCLIGLPVAALLAWLSYRYVERPWRTRRAATPAPVHAVAAAAAAATTAPEVPPAPLPQET